MVDDDVASVVRLSKDIERILKRKGVWGSFTISESLTGEPEPTVFLRLSDHSDEERVEKAEVALCEEERGFRFTLGTGEDGEVLIRVRGGC